MRERPAAQPGPTGEQPGRLRRRSQFLAVARGVRAATPSLVLQALRHDGDEPRIGFTTSRKVGNAVERNRARRRLREAARAIAPAYARPDHDYVIVGRRATLSAEYASILHDLTRAFARAHKQTDRPGKDSSDG